ncbi:TFIIH subunit Tfb4/p34 [Kipferlia bialata]|uniref:TFIIH subunit Tfb4/p34 n=1 Tax=Kipferlia bialata TaxID=797122 RepID=A0A9K3CSU8_9EUKA|nr:TFIIH subunit Tfb4/p34 [Kipferlia bialata]|eukprot:g3383.t1
MAPTKPSLLAQKKLYLNVSLSPEGVYDKLPELLVIVLDLCNNSGNQVAETYADCLLSCVLFVGSSHLLALRSNSLVILGADHESVTPIYSSVAPTALPPNPQLLRAALQAAPSPASVPVGEAPMLIPAITRALAFANTASETKGLTRARILVIAKGPPKPRPSMLASALFIARLKGIPIDIALLASETPAVLSQAAALTRGSLIGLTVPMGTANQVTLPVTLTQTLMRVSPSVAARKTLRSGVNDSVNFGAMCSLPEHQAMSVHVA